VGFEQGTQSLTNDVVVIREQDANHGFLLRQSKDRGWEMFDSLIWRCEL
jgi:hypothetical protein